MTVTIELPDVLKPKLERRAEQDRRSVEEVAAGLVVDGLHNEWETPEEVVARIKATPPNPNALRPGDGRLAELLRSAPQDPDFDLAAWQRDWDAVEAEMKARDLADDAAEGRFHT